MPIKILNGEFETFKFSGGEIHVRVLKTPGPANILATINNSDDIMTLLLLCDALKRMGKTIETIIIPYFPYARQDRVCNRGEALSVKIMADLINSIGAGQVVIHDPHSDVTPALINNYFVTKLDDLCPPEILEGKMIICPDAGAEKKIRLLKRPYILCTKDRDTATGEIKRTIVHHHGSLDGQNCIIVDDICDGGRTFIEIAKVLKSKNAGTIDLYVTHGIFSKGMEVFKGLIDKVYYYKEGELQCWSSGKY